MAWFQNLTVVLKFLPLLFVGIVGWFFVSKGNFGAFNASGGSLYSAIGIAAGVALFSFIGVEVAAVTAKRVRDPRRNVGRASLIGTGASAILYLVTAAVVMGLVPHHALAGSTTPFVTAFETVFSHGAWAGKLVAAVAVVSGIGALLLLRRRRAEQHGELAARHRRDARHGRAHLRARLAPAST